MRIAIVTGVAACLLAGCTSDADRVEKVAEWLCRYGQLEELQPMGLPDGEQLSEYVRAEDVAFLDTQREDDGKAAGAFGGLAQAMEAAMKPAARAIVQARASHTQCEVSVDVQGETATARVRQTVPKLGQGNPFERLQELAQLDDHDARVARATEWFDDTTESETHEHTLRFIETSDGWRADLQLPERDRAREREEIEHQIAELESQLQAAERARESLARFEVLEAAYRRIRRRFRDQAVIGLSVRNGTGSAVSRAYFRGRLVTPGRQVPWIAEDFNYAIAGGLEPGEEARWSLEPSIISDWARVDAPEEAVLEVEVVRIDGADGDPLYSVMDVDQGTAEELQSLRRELAELTE